MTEDSTSPRPDAGPATLDATGALADLAQRYWDAQLEASPLTASLLGMHHYDDRIDDLSEAAEDTRRAQLEAFAAELRRIDHHALDPAGRVTAALLGHQIDAGIEAAVLRLAELASDHLDGPHAALLMIAPQLSYPDPSLAAKALVRYSQVPGFLGQALDRFRSGLLRGRTPAAAVIARSVNSLDGYLASDVDQDPFLSPQLPSEWADDGDEASAWRAEALELVTTRIRPSFARYRDALRDELGAVARSDEHAGWSWLPDGDRLYSALVRSHTTVELSPAEIHELGRRLCEVDLPAEFVSIGATVFGDGSDGAAMDLAAVFDRLRQDPSLRHRDADEVVEIAERSVQRATEAASAWFGRLPVAGCEVAPIPDFLAADAPYAYYFPPAIDGSRPGTYFINTADPEGASRTEAESIAFHEAIPGHHLQITISQEIDDLPEFQRHDGTTSYVEGWGLYAERLADEMGLYSGELDRLGMVTADAWRSARLVVDTGLHALGWSRQQAIDYFVEHTPVPIDQIAPEVDRYLAIPGQALSYKIGQHEIQRLRAHATDALGDRFDVAGFHDVVLGSGAVTLPVLAGIVDAWIEERSAA